MSENIPESVPTSTSKISQRPTKKRALSPHSAQSAHLSTLFANPDRALSSSQTPAQKSALLPPEIVANVQGSSAGAGSGEFHVYKASRRREYERLRAMDEEKEKEEGDRVFEREREERRRKDEERTEKKRREREKAKARKGKKKGGAGVEGGAVIIKDGGSVAKKLKPNTAVAGDGKAGNGEIEDVGNEEEIGIVIHDDD